MSGLKVIIQIPCFNEENTLAATLAELPRTIPGIETVEWLIIDDGSEDRTVEVARANGVDHVLSFGTNRGLARAFSAGVTACLRLGADIIVNTDADNQYPGAYIPELVAPIVQGKAEMVIADRQTSTVEHFGKGKKILQAIGSWVVRQASGTNVPDAVSGFRALSRTAALRLFVVSDYTYTIESIIQAGSHGTKIASIPIRTNPKTRESRLIRSLWIYLRRSGSTILRSYTMYRPLRLFLGLAIATFLPALVLFARFLFVYITSNDHDRFIQSLIVAAVLTLTAVQFVVFAFMADLIASNRRLLEDVLVRLKEDEWRRGRDGQVPIELAARVPHGASGRVGGGVTDSTGHSL